MAELNTPEVRKSANNRMLAMDIRDFQQISPILKSLQQNTALILKDYHAYLQNKQRKTVGIPYNLLRKFEIVKGLLNQAQKTLDYQCQYYKNAVSNRQYDKMNQQSFFVQTMKSYDERRLQMKAYILKMQGQIQMIEDEVRKDNDFQTHKYTQFISEISLQRLERNYLNRSTCLQEVKQTIAKNASLRRMLHAKVNLVKSKQGSMIKQSTPLNQLEINGQGFQQKVKPAIVQRKGFNIQQSLYKISAFLSSYLIKKTVRNELLNSHLSQIRKDKARLRHSNQCLRKGLEQLQKKIQSKVFQYDIIYELTKAVQEDRAFQQKVPKNSNITKTDLLIYIKQMQIQVNQRINKYGYSFEHQPVASKLGSKIVYSKSCEKVYSLSTPSANKKNYVHQQNLRYFKEYRHNQLERILKQRFSNIRQPHIGQECQNSADLDQTDKEDFSIGQIQHKCQQLQLQLASLNVCSCKSSRFNRFDIDNISSQME